MAERNNNQAALMNSNERMDDFIGLISDERCKTILRAPEGMQLFEALDCELFTSSGHFPYGILITSAEPGEGRSTIAMLLAGFRAVFDKAINVLLLDAHMNGNGVSKLFIQSRHQPFGIEDYFWDDDVVIDNCITRTSLNNFHLLNCRGIAACHFSQTRFAQLFAETLQRYQLIIVDGPAAGPHPDAVAMAKTVGRAIIVVQSGGPRREQIQRIEQQIQSAGATIAGVVLNKRIFPVPQLLYNII